MATGTGNLPYPMLPVSPFDVITSQAENERIANIESLADGTGIGDNAVTSAKIAEAFFKGRKQANTTNSDISGYKVQHGWGFVVGSGAKSTYETVTLPTAFSSANYIVVATSLGYKPTSDPTSESNANFAPTIFANAKVSSASDFTVGLYDVNEVMGATTRFLYSWIAIGPA